MFTRSGTLSLALAALSFASLIPADAANAQCRPGLYDRAAWVADVPFDFLHGLEATVTVIDDKTLQVENFSYDGSAPLVYFYLGADNTYNAFLNGLQLEPLLDRAYDNETLTLRLPDNETMDDYAAISVWCAEFDVNFSSASFESPPAYYPRAGWVADIPFGQHAVEGQATIITDRLIWVENFTYDGTAPAVYFYLGETDTFDDFLNGLETDPNLDRAYDNESLVVTLPDGESLDGYGAISVWCQAFDVNFSSASFERPFPAGDLDLDGDVDQADLGQLLSSYGINDGGDVDCDGDTDQADLGALLANYGQ